MSNKNFSRWFKLPKLTDKPTDEQIDRLIERIDRLPEEDQRDVERLIDRMIARHEKQEKFRDWLQKEMTYRGFTLDALLAASGLDADAIERIIHCGEEGYEIGYEECDAIADGLGLPSDTVFNAAGLSTHAAMRYAEAPFWVDWIRILTHLKQMTPRDAIDYAKFVYKRHQQEKADPNEDYYLTRMGEWLMSTLTPKQQQEVIQYIHQLYVHQIAEEMQVRLGDAGREEITEEHPDQVFAEAQAIYDELNEEDQAEFIKHLKEKQGQKLHTLFKRRTNRN